THRWNVRVRHLGQAHAAHPHGSRSGREETAIPCQCCRTLAVRIDAELDPGTAPLETRYRSPGHRRVFGLSGGARPAYRVPGREATAAGAPAHVRGRYTEARDQALLGRFLHAETEAVGRRTARRIGRPS